MILIAKSYHERGGKQGEGGDVTGKFSESRLSHLRKNALFEKRGHYNKGP